MNSASLKRTPSLWLVLIGALLSAPCVQAQTYSKIETIEYHDNTAKWVLGQVKRTTTNGTETSRTVFDTNTALPLQTYAFNKLEQTLTYDTGATVASGQLGTLKTVKDGKNNITTLTIWKRGIPQNIKYPITPESPTGAVLSAVVNDNGWITSVTDENGFVTNYGHDPMGRLSSITYPTGDAVAWLPTTQVFEPVAAIEYGIPAGHWRQTITTGNAKKIAYFDAMWRPLVTREYDAANVAGTQRFQRFAYDANGRLSFASYHGTTDALTTGTWSLYDPLGRPTSTSQDSELGLLTTTTSYDAGFKTTVTNPRGKSTTTSYLTYDVPSTNAPLTIMLPEGVTIAIVRDPYGKPESITRSGAFAGSTLSLTRSYVYDTYQRLCVTNNPESGATIVDYDGAGNLLWSADGLALTSSCDRATGAAASRKIGFTYDARNRPTARTTAGGVANVETTYAPDGKVTQLVTHHATADTITNTYTYNRRRLLARETIQVNVLTPWGFDYGYNASGHLNSQTYPGNLVVGYAPDALGRPTQVGTFASNVTYYPNGAISGFTYGNSIVHTMTQNARRLPARSLDAFGATKFLDDTYTYDGNGNVLSMADAAGTGINNRTWGVAAPTLYDGLDRLLSVRGTNWGSLTGSYNALYSYDPLDNIRSAKIGAAGYSHAYDVGPGTGGTDRLLSMLLNGGTTYAIGTDAAGNIISDARTSHGYQFDVAHRLTAVTGPGAENYLYDGHGRRARTLNSTTGTIEYFGYGADGRLLQDWSSRRGNRKGYVYLGNTLVGTYGVTTVNPNLGAIGVEYKHTDALGSPVLTTDPARTISGRQLYTPYGVPLTPVDGVGYTGHVNDVGTGLTYMQQRYYDPAIGRFLSVDPVAARETGDNFNRYWYGNNNPYKFTDPDGRESGAFYTNPEYHMAAPQLSPKESGVALLAMVAPFAPEAAGMVRVAVALFRTDKPSAKERADEVHSKLDHRAQTHRTTAVTETREGIRVVSSSERRLAPTQRADLRPGEVEGVGVGHAEATGVRAANEMGLTPTGTAASRPICESCANTLRSEAVQPLSPLKKPN